MRETNLAQRWELHLADIGTAERRRDAFERLAAAYSEPHRRYHNLAHIAHCLAELDVAGRAAPQPWTVESAIWFHDIVYHPRGHDNELRSAEAADAMLKRLGLSQTYRDDVRRLILATRHASLPAELDEQLVADIDITILGQPPAVYDEYARAIRGEYAHVDDASFRAGRALILRRFLDRPHIYATRDFQQRYERRARENVTREVAGLD